MYFIPRALPVCPIAKEKKALEAYKKNELKEKLREAQLPVTSNKDNSINRLIKAGIMGSGGE